MKTVGNAKIICIAGYSSAGKSTAAEILQKQLSDAKIICADEFMFESIMHNKEEVENLIGFPVDTDSGVEYLRKYTPDLTVDILKGFLEIALPYVEAEFEKKIRDTIQKYNPQYIILVWLMLPACAVWHTAHSRLVIHPKDWSLLVDAFLSRGGFGKSDETPNRRRAAVEDVIEKINKDETQIIYNDYMGEKGVFHQELINFANLMKTQ